MELLFFRENSRDATKVHRHSSPDVSFGDAAANGDRVLVVSPGIEATSFFFLFFFSIEFLERRSVVPLHQLDT